MRRRFDRALRSPAASLRPSPRAAPSAASAAGQTYTVLQCHPLNRAHADSILEDAPAYATDGFCGDPQNDHAIKVTSTAGPASPLGKGRAGRPDRDTSPSYPWTFGRSFVATTATRRASGWPIRAKTRSRASPAGARGPTGYRHYSWRTAWTRLETTRREPLLPEHGRLPAIRPREDLGAKRPAEGRRLLGSEASRALDGTAARSAAGFAAPRNVHAQASDSGSGLGQLVVTVNGSAACSPGLEPATAIPAPPMPLGFQPCAA